MSTMSPAPTTATPPRSVPTRRVSFEDSLASLPRHFAADGDLLHSHLIAAMSSVFPDGEDFFVRSVRHFRDQITDPELRRQVSGFIGQESVHGREHRALNARLAELGYPTLFIEKVTRRLLATRSKVFTAKANLAATAALEHFTATMAELLLTDEEARAVLGHEAVVDLFVWHALEESEHKAVAFDVYRAVGGSERTRVITMKALRVGFVAAMIVEMAVSLSMDRATFQRGRLRASLRGFRSAPMFDPDFWAQLREYDRRDFHPDDRDTTELVEVWRRELFGEGGSMVHRLAGAGSAA